MDSPLAGKQSHVEEVLTFTNYNQEETSCPTQYSKHFKPRQGQQLWEL